jgi:NAD(P)-dependent dehydrogenase (short-subunit alcohol dehydrogenase family)
MTATAAKPVGRQRVLITAGAAGIGRATADLLIAQGARVMVCDLDEAALADFASVHPGHGAIRADVSDEAQVEATFRSADAHLGGLDALINNAGVAGPTGGIETLSLADWQRCLDVGLTGQFLFARGAVPRLRASGGGSIVCMSSAAGRHGYAFRTPYASVKWGVIGLMQSLAKELGPSNIRVNAILPGIVEGPRMAGVIRDRAVALGIPEAEMRERYLEKVSLRRMVSQSDVAAMIAFILSPAGASISGQSLGVDGNVETL